MTESKRWVYSKRGHGDGWKVLIKEGRTYYHVAASYGKGTHQYLKTECLVRSDEEHQAALKSDAKKLEELKAAQEQELAAEIVAVRDAACAITVHGPKGFEELECAWAKVLSEAAELSRKNRQSRAIALRNLLNKKP